VQHKDFTVKNQILEEWERIADASDIPCLMYVKGKTLVIECEDMGIIP